MGGYGSTRWMFHIRKENTGECLRLSISDLKRLNMLGVSENTSILSNSLVWSIRGKRIADVWLDVMLSEENNITLEARLRYSLKSGKSISSTIQITQTIQPPRHWFICPQCQRRVGVLYLPPSNPYFKCRHCHNLAYESSQESRKFPASLQEFGKALRLMEKLEKEFNRYQSRTRGKSS